MRKITEIIVHATATRADWWANRRTADKVAEVKAWHVDPKPKGRGWSDIGYHFLIDRDGTVAEGRPIERTGAHVKGHNTGTIGITLFGGHGGEKDNAFADNFTEDQDAALRKLVARLQAEYGPGLKLSGHHEYANKACPCFDVRKWFARKAVQPRHLGQSRTMQGLAASGVGAAMQEGADAVAGLVSDLPEDAGFLSVLKITGLVLTVGGIGFAVYARWDDWEAGHR